MRRSSIRDIGLPEMRLGWPVLAVPPIVVAILLLLLLAADPAAGITTSNGIRTDEAWDVINARNLVLLGHWSTDDWNLHLVNVPYSVVMAAVFSAFGVGIEQARLVSVAATAITIGALGLGLRRALGGGAALLAAVAFGGATLVLYYGRLAFLEPTVTMWLTIGGLLVLRARSDRSGRWGSGAGIAFALAIGTKPSVLFAITGLLIAVAVVGIRDAAPRRWLTGATAVIVVAAIGWTVLIGLPNREAVATDIRIWAAEPSSPRRRRSYGRWRRSRSATTTCSSSRCPSWSSLRRERSSRSGLAAGCILRSSTSPPRPSAGSLPATACSRLRPIAPTDTSSRSSRPSRSSARSAGAA
jgi:hypothetical protein